MNSKNHKNGELAAEQHLSRVQQVYYWHEQTHKAPNIDSFLARLSLALGWQSKQLDCHSTVFHPNNPLCPTPGPLSACTPTALLSPCGGPTSLQSALCWSSSWVTNSYSPAEQDHTCQSKGNTCWRVAMARVATCGLDQGSHWIRLHVLTLKHKDKSRTSIYAYSLCLKRETMFGRCAKEDSQIFVKRKKIQAASSWSQ